MAIKVEVQDRIEGRKLLELALSKLRRALELGDNFLVPRSVFSEFDIGS